MRSVFVIVRQADTITPAEKSLMPPHGPAAPRSALCRPGNGGTVASCVRGAVTHTKHNLPQHNKYARKRNNHSTGKRQFSVLLHSVTSFEITSHMKLRCVVLIRAMFNRRFSPKKRAGRGNETHLWMRKSLPSSISFFFAQCSSFVQFSKFLRKQNKAPP